MTEVAPVAELNWLLTEFDSQGGVVEYVFFEASDDAPAQLHRAAAVAGIGVIARRHEPYYRVDWDETKLVGAKISFPEFWGSDDIAGKWINDEYVTIPNVDGYKTAFFCTPHGLRSPATKNHLLFAEINRFVLGEDPNKAEIFAWSTNWSNYFDSGNEWWGAFFWTIRPAGSLSLQVVTASTTD